MSVLTEGGPVTIRIRDADGTVVFEVEAAAADQAASPQVVRLSAGVHTVECAPTNGPPTTATLRVVEPT